MRLPRGPAALQPKEVIQIDSDPMQYDSYNRSNNNNNTPQASQNHRAPQFEDGKYGFSNGSSATRPDRSAYTARRGRGRQYGGLESDVIMRDKQDDRRSGW
jgi:hypothetical protein